MAVQRGPARRHEREEVVAYIHGIDPQGDVAHILVHKRGSSVRFSGELGEHKVSRSNEADLEKWVQEAEIVWQLDDAIGVPRGFMNAPGTLEKIELISINAAKKKKELEGAIQLST